MAHPEPAHRTRYALFYDVPTRWADNDIYGHANNVVYYAWFDTVVNQFLIERGGMRPGHDPVVGYVVASACDYFAPVSYPEILELGLRIERLGTKSVSWELGVFSATEDTTRAVGRFTHAFVDQASGKSAAIPPTILKALEALL